MIVRSATPGDVPEIAAIYDHWVLHGTASFEIDPPGVAEIAKRFDAIVSAGYPYLVAEDGGRIAGYAYASAYRPRRAYRFTVEDSIYVSPYVQRGGVGRLLLARLIEESEQRGYRQMIAVIGDSRQTPSIELHRSLGFEMVGTLRSIGYKFDRWLDGVLMQRALGPGDGASPV